MEWEIFQVVYVNKLPRPVLASKTDEITIALHIELTPWVSGTFKIVTVRDNTMTILKKSIKNKITVDSETQMPDLSKAHHGNDDKNNIPKRQLLSQNDETQHMDTEEYVVHRIIGHIIYDDVAIYKLTR